MRYINLNDLELPEGWLAKAQKLTQDLNDADDSDARKVIIDLAKNEIWKELFIPMQSLSNGKCWYSEANDVMSDRDIDHFRPKKQAKNINDIPRADEDGYWYLCYDYENYRFSSQYSNQLRKDKFNPDKETRGKGVYFPLFEASVVGKTKNQCEDEDIVLLDPCDENDPTLLTFDFDGTAIPNAVAILEPKDEIRVNTSIKLYHLDHQPLVETRERLWGFCQRMIDRIRAISIDPHDVSIRGKNEVKHLKNEIRKLTARNQELSAVAIACCEENGLTMLAERR
ncbi:MAG: hypothetical protein ACI9Q3_000824 [Maribacter sp.]|jgi:hypothetical protein